MKCFLKGIFGGVVIIAMAAFVFPLYSDYRARAETDAWIIQIEHVQQNIESIASRQKSFAGIASSIGKSAPSLTNATVFEITDSGSIIVKGGRDGQMLVLSPKFVAEKIEWRCIGGPTKDMPIKCRQ